MHKYIGHLQVSVDHVLLSEIVKTLEDVPDDGLGLVLIKIALFPESGLEIALVAEFCNDIAIPIAGEDLIAFENIDVI
jgi:hypothetical protein